MTIQKLKGIWIPIEILLNKDLVPLIMNIKNSTEPIGKNNYLDSEKELEPIDGHENTGGEIYYEMEPLIINLK